MSSIKGHEAAEKALRTLLETIEEDLKTARDSGEDDTVQKAVDKAARQLVVFTQSTRAQNPLDQDEVNAIKRIDELASDTRRKIRAARISELIERIEDAADELSQLSKDVEREAEENLEAARRLRLLPIKEAIEELTVVVDSLKETKTALKAADDSEKTVSMRIERLLKAFTDLKKSVKDAYI